MKTPAMTPMVQQLLAIPTDGGLVIATHDVGREHQILLVGVLLGVVLTTLTFLLVSELAAMWRGRR